MFLRKTALRHYRKALVRKYESVRIPFRDRAPLKMAEVFVPLQVTGRADGVQMAAMQAISRFKRLMVVGEPGAGKTMLMKHVAFHYAEHGLDGYGIQAVPVLLELNRAADPNTSLLQHLAHILEQNDFPRAEHYVEQALNKGELLQAFESYNRKPKEDWRNSRSVIGYSVATGWHLALAGIIALLLIASSLYAMGLYCWENWQYLVDNRAYATVNVLTLIVLLIHFVYVIYNDYDSLREKLLWGCLCIAGGAGLIIYALVKGNISLWTDIRSGMMILAISVWGTLVLYFAANYVHQFYSWPWVAALWLIWYGCAIALNLIANQKEHQAKKTLAGII
jgi:hypothetical protein